MKKTRVTEEKMVTILREADTKPVPDVAKKHGVSGQTIYSWRKHFGSLEPSDVKRLRQLDQENGRLKKMVADRDLEVDVLKEITRKKAISEFPKWRKYLILLSFLDNSSARPVQIGGVDANICHSRVDRSPRTPAVQFAIPPRGDHFVAHGRALWKLTGRGRTERAHRAVENAVRFPRASTGPFPSSHPRKTPKGP